MGTMHPVLRSVCIRTAALVLASLLLQLGEGVSFLPHALKGVSGWDWVSPPLGCKLHVGRDHVLLFLGNAQHLAEKGLR